MNSIKFKTQPLTKYNLLFYFILAGIMILNACKPDEERPLNPNGDSELAVLMRDMYEEALQAKKALEKGKKPVLKLDHKAILTAEATKPEEVSTPEYKAYARAYMFSIRQLQTNMYGDPWKAYDKMVGTCTACHQMSCPGPLERIKKLKRTE